MASGFRLLADRRFAPMFLCTCLSAFNDNYYKNALTILITYQLSQSLHSNPASIISLAAALFILPFFLFSGIAGRVADRYAKHTLVRISKITEVLLFTCATIALIHAHITALLIVLALLGTQATFFGPVKYAILPSLLKENELIAGNGMTEAGTFVTILLGTMLGGLLILQPQGAYIVGVSMIAISVLGLIASYFVPHTNTANASVALSFNPFITMIEMLKLSFANKTVWFAIIGISWFWAVGATYLTQLPVFTKNVIGGNEQIVTLFMATFSVGVGLGSLACNRMMHGKISLKYAPWALLGITCTGLDIWFATANVHQATGQLIGLKDYLNDWQDFRLVIDLAILSICGGVFIVPLYTLLQTRGEESMRARAIAGNNVMNAFFISVVSLAAAGAYSQGFDVRDVFFVTALLGFPASYWVLRKTRTFVA